jgi:hypothetical protein
MAMPNRESGKNYEQPAEQRIRESMRGILDKVDRLTPGEEFDRDRLEGYFDLRLSEGLGALLAECSTWEKTPEGKLKFLRLGKMEKKQKPPAEDGPKQE